MQDFDLHGLVGIRLLDATSRDIATVCRQLGPLEATLDREPDITVRFVDRATTRPLTFVGVDECGFNEDGFFVLEGTGRVAARARVPFDHIGDHPEICCERSMPAVPHLLAVINLTALAKGVLPLHASAWTTDGLGVLVAGWAKGGKTESLLGSMAAGASYVGDEWVYLTAGRGMYGLPEPIRLWSWQLRQLGDLLSSRPRRDRARLAAWHQLAGLAGRASALRFPAAGLARRGAPVLKRQAYLQIPPVDLFGADHVALRGRLDVAILVASHEKATTMARRTEPGELAARMAASLMTERAQFLDHYRQFCFAFPHRRSALVHDAETLERGLLADRLGDVCTAAVFHPYPCDVRVLGRVVAATAAEAAGRS